MAGRERLGAVAEGKHDEALRTMSAAADVEDKTEKAPVTPGPIAPARELFGYMLLERGMAREALAAFKSTQVKEPNRYHGYAGAALAAERLGDKAKVKSNYEKLVVLGSDADAGRPELVPLASTSRAINNRHRTRWRARRPSFWRQLRSSCAALRARLSYPQLARR